MLESYLSMINTEEEKNKVELLYNAYRNLMFYIARQILKDDTLAEDAVHDTFVKIIENSDKIREIYCKKTKRLAVAMVRNHAINLYNKRKKRYIVPFEELEYMMSDDTNIVYEGESVLVQAINELPDIYRHTLTLKYLQELSNQDIAYMLDISEAAIRKRLERAKYKLQIMLGKKPY